MLRFETKFVQPLRPRFSLFVAAAFQMLDFPTAQLNVCMAIVNILLNLTAKSLSDRYKLLRLGFAFEVLDDPILRMELENLHSLVSVFVIVPFLSAVSMQRFESGLVEPALPLMDQFVGSDCKFCPFRLLIRHVHMSIVILWF